MKEATFYLRHGKRTLDIVGSSLALVLLSPIVLLTAGFVFCTLGRPILFRQTRPGRHGRPFRLLKFRSMAPPMLGSGKALPDEQRLTPAGSFLRAYSLDELPEFWNVIRGEMSLVGPRPLLLRYLSRFTPDQRRRLAVKPGISGWAQVNGRNALSWEAKFSLDHWYVDHLSFYLDLKILLLTITAVLRPRGVSQPGHATTEEFNPCLESRRDQP